MDIDQNEENSLFSADELMSRPVSIKLVGVGGAGSNAVDRLKMDNLDQVRLVTVNTDSQALAASPVEEKILIGASVTRGLGAGGDPELGRLAAEAERDKLSKSLSGTDLVFLVAGMGGGTGSGAAPVVAELAAKAGSLVIAFVTLPFSFEGGRRLKQADEGLLALRSVCDAVIPLPNDILMQQAEENSSVLDAFARADAWIDRAVKSIWAMLFRTGLINIDFATLRQAFNEKGGKTLFGLGAGKGDDFVASALEDFKGCPLLHTPEFSRRADRLLVNIVGGTDLTLTHVNEIMAEVTEEFGRNAHVVMGAVIDESFQNAVEICVIGTTDLSSRATVGTRRGAAAVSGKRQSSRAAVIAAAEAAGFGSGRKEETAKAAQAEPAAATAGQPGTAQEEFAFTDSRSRGHFDHTDRNFFEGEDLDLPTFFRKGVKINA